MKEGLRFDSPIVVRTVKKVRKGAFLHLVNHRNAVSGMASSWTTRNSVEFFHLFA
jgi:hypothetical protein